jgi:hypothetical protein
VIGSSASRMFFITGPVTSSTSAWRGDEADAETLDVAIGVVERVNFQLAAIAGSGVDLADR